METSTRAGTSAGQSISWLTTPKVLLVDDHGDRVAGLVTLSASGRHDVTG